MKRLFWPLVTVGLVVAVLVALRPTPLVVAMGSPTVRTVQEYITEEAKTRLDDEYLLDAPVSGTVARITLEVGDYVEAGQTVAQIDTFELEQQVAGMRSMIEKVEAQIAGVDIGKPKEEDKDSASMRVRELADILKIAERERNIVEIDHAESKKEFMRIERLVAEGVASQSQLDAAERRYRSLEQNIARARLAEDAAKKTLDISALASKRLLGSVDDNEYMREAYLAEIKQLEAMLSVLLSDLGKTSIVSPVSGPILEKYVEDRRVLAAGTPLLKVGALDSIEIESDLLSEEVVRVTVGDPVEIVGKALQGETVQGRVERIYPSAFMKISSLGIEQQRVKVIIAFDNKTLNLRPGTRLDVRVVTAAQEKTVAVPERAIFRRDGQWHVFVVQGGVAELTPVTVGLRNDRWAEIIDGVSVDDLIVLETMNELTSGARVVKKG